MKNIPCWFCGEPNPNWHGIVPKVYCDACLALHHFVWGLWFAAVLPMRLFWPAEAPPPTWDQWTF